MAHCNDNHGDNDDALGLEPLPFDLDDTDTELMSTSPSSHTKCEDLCVDIPTEGSSDSEILPMNDDTYDFKLETENNIKELDSKASSVPGAASASVATPTDPTRNSAAPPKPNLCQNCLNPSMRLIYVYLDYFTKQ